MSGLPHQRQLGRGVVQAGHPEHVLGQAIGDGHRPVVGAQLVRPGVHVRRGPVVLQPDAERRVDRRDRPGGPHVVALRVGLNAGEALAAQPRLHRARRGRAGPEPGRVGVRAQVVVEQLAARRAHRRRVPLRRGQLPGRSQTWMVSRAEPATAPISGPWRAKARRCRQPQVALARCGTGRAAQAHIVMAATVAAAAVRLTSLGLLVTRSPCPRTRPKCWARSVCDSPANQDARRGIPVIDPDRYEPTAPPTGWLERRGQAGASWAFLRRLGPPRMARTALRPSRRPGRHRACA